HGLGRRAPVASRRAGAGARARRPDRDGAEPGTHAHRLDRRAGCTRRRRGGDHRPPGRRGDHRGRRRRTAWPRPASRGDHARSARGPRLSLGWSSGELIAVLERTTSAGRAIRPRFLARTTGGGSVVAGLLLTLTACATSPPPAVTSEARAAAWLDAHR